MRALPPRSRPGAVRPPLAPNLLRPLVKRPATPEAKPGSLWPVGLLMLIGFIAACLADATTEAWPLAVLMAVPLAALAADRIGRWQTDLGRREF